MGSSAAQSEVSSAVADVRAGTLAVVTIEGEPGLGKSTMLRRLAEDLSGFEVRRAFGDEGDETTPFGLLNEMMSSHDLSAATNPLHATRVLTDWLDRGPDARPIAYLIDDLQWADAESVDALATVARRSAHDRVFLVAAFRPLGRAHPLWQRMMRDLPAHHMTLSGLDVEGVGELVRGTMPEASPALVAALSAHTAGNPLYLAGLMREHDLGELTRMAARDELPAPTELVSHLETRLARMSPDAAALLTSLAVSGDRWTELATAAAIGDVDDPIQAARILLDQTLIRTEGSGAHAKARIYHSVVRAAVYDGIPASQRRRLHSAAAARVLDPGARLQHRVAAASGPDAQLVDDLRSYARSMQIVRRSRESERFLRLAAEVTPAERERQELIRAAEIEILLSTGTDDVSDPAVDERSDPLTRFVAALRAWLNGDPKGAYGLLAPVTPDELAVLTDLDRYRFHIMRAYIAVAAEHRTPAVRTDIAEAEAIGCTDPATQIYLGTASVVISERHLLPEPEGWAALGRGIDRVQLLAQPYGAGLLPYRGLSFAICGFTSDAIDDLSLATSLIADGTIDFHGGAYHAMLGLAYFLSGQWQRASIAMEVAGSSAMGSRHVTVYGAHPLAMLAKGDLDGARGALEHSRTSRIRDQIGIAYNEDIVDVLVWAFIGSEHERRSYRARRMADFGVPVPGAWGPITYLWTFVHGLAAIWADDLDSGRAWAADLDARSMGPAWVDQAFRWLHALMDDAGGTDATSTLSAIADEGFEDLPVFNALASSAAAASARRHGRADATALWERASGQLIALGGSALLTGLPPAPSESAPGVPIDGRLEALSERERAVAQLVAEGMSYAEIARELYVTRSTVGFHLTNCYAKTNTSSRHALARLVRQGTGPAAAPRTSARIQH